MQKRNALIAFSGPEIPFRSRGIPEVTLPRDSKGVPARPVAGLLLAAGLSSRMGSQKALLELEGESLVRRAARRALAGGLDPLVVVVGHEADRVSSELAGLPCRIELNPHFASGIASSLRVGVAALGDQIDAAMVLLADMPFVTAEMIATLAERWREHRPPLVISEYGGVPAPPTLYDRRLFPELRELRDGQSGREIVKRHRAEALIVEWPATALADLDVPEDYTRAKRAER